MNVDIVNLAWLALVNQGETINDYPGQVSSSTFIPDSDYTIPVLDDGYFEDDIVGRFKEFLNLIFGEIMRYDEILDNRADEYIDIDIDIDLNDGVKVNDEKFKELVEKIWIRR